MFSALPLKPDIAEYGRHVRFVLPDSCTAIGALFDHLIVISTVNWLILGASATLSNQDWT
jgi:hypothetical protein